MRVSLIYPVCRKTRSGVYWNIQFGQLRCESHLAHLIPSSDGTQLVLSCDQSLVFEMVEVIIHILFALDIIQSLVPTRTSTLL